MKKALLATSAIIAAGVIAAPAIAAEKKAAGPIALKLGGYFTLLAVHTSQDDGAGQRNPTKHRVNHEDSGQKQWRKGRIKQREDTWTSEITPQGRKVPQALGSSAATHQSLRNTAGKR